MSKHLEREIELLKSKLLTLGTLVEENLNRAVQAVLTRDAVKAQSVVGHDGAIDELEVEVEEQCITVVALQQPVAADLRWAMAVLKINRELERIGDLAVTLAQVSLRLDPPTIELPFAFERMALRAQWMLKHGLDALVRLDTQLARQVWAADDEVNQIHRAMYGTVEAAMRDCPELLGGLLQAPELSQSLERIGDHAKNIAKDVIYLVEGSIVRHRGGEYKAGVVVDDVGQGS